MNFAIALICGAILLCEGAIETKFKTSTVTPTCPSSCPKADKEASWTTMHTCMDDAEKEESICNLSGGFSVVSGDEVDGTCASSPQAKGHWQFPGAGVKHDGLTLTVQARSLIRLVMKNTSEAACTIIFKSAQADPKDGTCGVSDEEAAIISQDVNQQIYSVPPDYQVSILALSHVGAVAMKKGVVGSRHKSIECGTEIESYKYNVSGTFVFSTAAISSTSTSETSGAGALLSGLATVAGLSLLI